MLGIAPAATTFITNFDLVAQGSTYCQFVQCFTSSTPGSLSLTLKSSLSFIATSSQISGKAYGADNTNSPTPSAIDDMLTAYTYGMSETTDVNNAGAGALDGLTLVPGV